MFANTGLSFREKVAGNQMIYFILGGITEMLHNINKVCQLLSRKSMTCNSIQFKCNFMYNWKPMQLLKLQYMTL